MDKKNKKATINPISKRDHKCFQYTVTVALNHEEIKKDPQRIPKIKSFINKYNWEGKKFPSEAIVLNALYVKKEKLCPAYVSKNNSNHENQVILLVIPNGDGHESKPKERWHYLAVNKLSALLTGITS